MIVVKSIRRVVFALLFGVGSLFLGLTSVLAADPYILGMSAAFTGPSQGLGVELYRGSQAYFSMVNKHGGVNGHAVLIEVNDDRYHPEPAIENTIEFIKREDILCLFNYVGTPTVTRILPLLKSYEGSKKYLFFPFTGAEPHRRQPYGRYVVNLRASYKEETAAIVDKLIQLGRSRIAVLCQADAYGRSGWEGVRNALDAHGLEIVGEATYRRGAGFDDVMARQVAILMRGNPDAVICFGSYAPCAAFIREMRDRNYDVPIVNVSFVGSENMLALLRNAGEEHARDYTANLINTQIVPSYEDLSLPAVREYRSLMDSAPRYAPGVHGDDYIPLKYSFTSFEGYLNAKVMVAILEKFSQNSKAGLLAAAESLHEIDLGIDVKARYGPDRRQGLDSVYFTTVQDGLFVPVTDVQWETWRQ